MLTWQHVNMHGTYDFSNLVVANSNEYSIDEAIHFKSRIMIITRLNLSQKTLSGRIKKTKILQKIFST